MSMSRFGLSREFIVKLTLPDGRVRPVAPLMVRLYRLVIELKSTALAIAGLSVTSRVRVFLFGNVIPCAPITVRLLRFVIGVKTTFERS